MAKLAVILACHDRRDMTVDSVRRVLCQGEKLCDIRVFVTDDGSIDGTAFDLVSLSPAVIVIPGSGQLYWAAAMALAERAAMSWSPDYLLWLNDDTVFDDDALCRLFAISESSPHAIVVGATREPTTGAGTYGARRRVTRWHPQRTALVSPSERVQYADTLNGNAVLIPFGVRQAVGPIDGLFPHAYADLDYGLRATALGIPVLQAPGTVGHCRPNQVALGTVRGLRAWKLLQAPKRMPWRAQLRFLRRHGGRAWPILFGFQQLAVLAGLRAVSSEPLPQDRHAAIRETFDLGHGS